MKVVILAGGLGTRLSEETTTRPKPMVELGGMPILWHIMKIYSHYGLHEFVVCLGHKGYLIKEYFANYFLHRSDVTIDLRTNHVRIHETMSEPWTVTLLDTGDYTSTGGRLKRIRNHVHGTFCLTYGDGLSDVNVLELIAFHRQQRACATVTAVQPPARYGRLAFSSGNVTGFTEKPTGDEGWVSGGYFVLEPEVFDYLGGDDTVWERDPMERLANDGKLSAYKHEGFWHAMDTLRDKIYLEGLWESGNAPWRIWS